MLSLSSILHRSCPRNSWEMRHFHLPNVLIGTLKLYCFYAVSSSYSNVLSLCKAHRVVSWFEMHYTYKYRCLALPIRSGIQTEYTVGSRVMWARTSCWQVEPWPQQLWVAVTHDQWGASPVCHGTRFRSVEPVRRHTGLCLSIWCHCSELEDKPTTARLHTVDTRGGD